MTTCTKIGIRLYIGPQLGGILDAKITFKSGDFPYDVSMNTLKFYL